MESFQQLRLKKCFFVETEATTGYFLSMFDYFRPATLLKKDFKTQVFSCEYSDIYKNSYFEEHLQTAVFL